MVQSTTTMYWNPFAAKSEQILTYLTRTMLCANYNNLFRIVAGQLQMDSSQFSAASHRTPLIVQQTFWECPFPFYEPFKEPIPACSRLGSHQLDTDG